jgi:flagellar assembly factor FliW
MNHDPALPSESATAASDGAVLITFPKGLLGFPEVTTFQLYEPTDGYPLKFLQSTERPEVSFICLDPASVKPDYEVPLTPEESEALRLEAPEDALILTLVVVPDDPRLMTTNLAGPLVINVKRRVGYQIILSSEKFPLRFPILPQA